MKIVIATNSLGGGGAERAMNLLANELHERGHSVILVPINEGVRDSVEVNCRIIPINRKYGASFFETFQAIFHFRSLLTSLNPDFVVLNCDLPELFGLILPKEMQLITVEHSIFPWSKRKLLGRGVRFLHRKRNTTFFAVSSHLTIWPNRANPERIVPNLVTAPKRQKVFNLGSSKIERLVFVGRLSPEKRPLWLLRIAKELSIPVIFIGSGDEELSLLKFSQENSISALFVGHQLKPWDLIIPGDLVLVPSLFEGDGLVVIEAISQGIPILLSDILEFRRFEFPHHFYASTETDFVNLIEKYRNSISTITVPKYIVDKLLDVRKRSNIGDIWEQALKERKTTVE